MTDLKSAIEFFSKDSYATETTGISIDAVGENYARCSLKIDKRHLNATGYVMGGVMYTLADFVFAVSTNSPEHTTVTTVSNINYLSPVKGDMLIGESKLLKNGKRNCFYEITIKDNLENVVAVVTTCGNHIEKNK